MTPSKVVRNGQKSSADSAYFNDRLRTIGDARTWRRRRVSANEDRVSQFVRGSFATWKFRALEAMAADRRLKPSDFKIGFVLMSRLSQETMRTFPSQAYLGRKTNMSERSVRACLNRLRAAGWLKWDRGNRQKANEYEFDRQTVADALALWEDSQGDRRQRDKSNSDRKQSSGQKAIPSGSRVPVATGSTVPPNTYIEQASRRKAVP